MPRMRSYNSDHGHDYYDQNEVISGLHVVHPTHSLSTGRRVGYLLGDDDSPSNTVPQKVVQELMVDFDIGDAFILALAQSGEIIAWGDNQDGQLNVPAEIYRASPIHLAEMGLTGIAQPDVGELEMLSAGGLGIHWGSNTQYEVQTTTDILGGEWGPLPAEANNRFYRIVPINE